MLPSTTQILFHWRKTSCLFLPLGGSMGLGYYQVLPAVATCSHMLSDSDAFSCCLLLSPVSYLCRLLPAVACSCHLVSAVFSCSQLFSAVASVFQQLLAVASSCQLLSVYVFILISRTHKQGIQLNHACIYKNLPFECCEAAKREYSNHKVNEPPLVSMTVINKVT
jgi:hypothetical protein